MGLKVYCGPMFAGKTSSLINEITRFELANKKCLVFKPEIDTRYSEEHIVTHTGVKVPCIRTTNLTQMLDLIGEYSPDVIVIDEIQFYPESIITLVQTYNQHKQVIIGGLDLSFRGEPFERTAHLLAMADTVVKLRAVCMSCGADATMTYAKSNPSSTIHVGGTETYEARCLKCWAS